MTHITDQQRREVAERLRATRPESELFWIQTCMLPAFARTEITGFEPMLDGLADLIDRPTCRDFGGEVGTTGEGYDFACSACGWMAGDCNGSIWRYCPNCGAEVTA